MRLPTPTLARTGPLNKRARCLEGVVAKKLGEHYRPGERSWVKRKNRDYWHYPLERESAIQSRGAAK